MEYREFRVTVEDQKRIRAQKPNRITLKGNIQMDYLKKRTINIFHTWLAEGNIKKREELVVLGSHLYDVLFSGEIGTSFKTTFDEIQQQRDTVLRVILEFEPEARDLATLPWEYIYFPDTERERGFFIATRSKLILTRHVPLNVAAPEDLTPEQKPLRILIVVCKPEELAEVKADPVVKTIAELQKGFPGDIEIDKLYQPTKRSFTDRVKSFRPHVLHFIGHGKYDKHNKLGGGSLAFVQEGDQKTATWIGDLDLADSFQDFQPRLIFLHACEGATSESYEGFRGVALQLVYSKVPAVVAMQYPIKNKVAIEFAKKFYQCLGEGKPIDVAVQEGRLELGMYLDERNFSSRAFGSPVVYLQSAEGIIIAEAQDEPKTQLQPPSTSFKVTCPYPDCTGMVIPSRRFCPACRRPLMRCPECDEVMAKDLEFCDNCGYNRESKAYHIEVTTVKRKADPFQVSRIDRQRPRM